MLVAHPLAAYLARLAGGLVARQRRGVSKPSPSHVTRRESRTLLVFWRLLQCVLVLSASLSLRCACCHAFGPSDPRFISSKSVPLGYLPSEGAPIPGGNGPGSLHDVELYDIDYSYSSAVIADLQSKGKKVMCYVSAGTSEDFRDDINLFPEDVKGGIVSFGEGDTVRACRTTAGVALRASYASAAATAELWG